MRCRARLFAIEAEGVREILDLVPITEVPSAPRLRRRTDQCARPRRAARRSAGDVRHGAAPNPTRIPASSSSRSSSTASPTIVGILADKVHDVTDIETAAIEEAPKVGMRWRSDYVRGIGKRNGDFIIIPDMGRIFETELGVAASRTPGEGKVS